MRIAFVAPGGFDRSGREHVIPVLLSLIERLARRHDVVVYVLRYHDRPRSYPLLGATIHDLGRPQGLWRQYLAVARAMGRDGPFDVVHGYWALPSGLVAALCGRRFGIPSVATCDSGEFIALPEIGYGSQSTRRQSMAVAAMSRIVNRLTVGSAFQAGLARNLGIASDVLPIGVDRARFTPAPRVEGPPWRLLSVARLHPVKAPHTLLDAFYALRQRGLDVLLDAVGEDMLAGSLDRRARDLGIDVQVTFHGSLASHDLLPLYQRAHLLVLPSLHEAGPVVALEAALCELPVVGSAVGFIADWAPDRAVGVPPRNPLALADAIQALIVDGGRRARMATAAREWALGHDADWSALTLEHLYAELRTTTPGS